MCQCVCQRVCPCVRLLVSMALIFGLRKQVKQGGVGGAEEKKREGSEEEEEDERREQDERM